MLHIAHVAEPTKAWDKRENVQRHSRRTQHLHALSDLNATATPDLVFFGGAEYGPKWQSSQVRSS